MAQFCREDIDFSWFENDHDIVDEEKKKNIAKFGYSKLPHPIPLTTCGGIEAWILGKKCLHYDQK